MVDAMDPKYAGQHSGSLAYLAQNPIPPPPPPDDAKRNAEVEIARDRDTWTILVIFRMANAVALLTFFQPDEYYQALEPAWELAFGKDSGAWITWEWQNQLRSSIQPLLHAGVYRAIAFLCDLAFPPTLRTVFLVLLPKTVLALFAALQDYYMWRMAEKIYGHRCTESTVILGLTLLSPWQWFVSTRAFSNCLETSLTTMALFYWPWEWMKPTTDVATRARDMKNLKYSIVLAALASILRPTNIIIWITLSLLTIPHAKQEEFFGMIRDASIYGSIVIFLSNILDRLYYGTWTFPALNFLRFNLFQNLAVFYGTNRPDYYFTEAIPLLLTTYLPFGITALYQSLTPRGVSLSTYPTAKPTSPTIIRTLVITALSLPTSLSFISHKETRFIYPILPILLLLSARPIASYFHPFPRAATYPRRFLFLLIISINLYLAAYIGFKHNSGIISVTTFLRAEFEWRNPNLNLGATASEINSTTVGVLMPCHSLPWRSHLVYPQIEAWALSCDPPLGLSEAQRQDYRDEADRFYDDPKAWMQKEMVTDAEADAPAGTKAGRRSWPMYLVFFEALEETLDVVPEAASLYEECWRGFNSHWHDDKRRRGDVVVWCRKEVVLES